MDDVHIIFEQASGSRSDIGVQKGQKILFGADKGRSHKTSRSYNRGSLVAGTTVLIFRSVLVPM